MATLVLGAIVTAIGGAMGGATFVAALRHNELTAPCVFDGPINGRLQAWVERFLIPPLKPWDIVVLDNPGSRRSAAALPGPQPLRASLR